MNILYSDKLSARFTDTQNGYYKPQDLIFFIPQKYNEYSVFLFLKDNALYDVCPLTFTGDVVSYKTYAVDGTYPLRVSGDCSISLILLKEHEIKLTECFTAFLDVEQYKIAQMTYLSQELSRSVSEAYSKITEMTNMNIELYELIRTKGDEST